jgi:hypothetical protein
MNALSMSEAPSQKDDPAMDDGKPPVFRTWQQMYAFVLVLHALIIFLFWLFTRTYS